MFNGIKNIIGLLALGIFAVALFQAIYGFDQILYPGISYILYLLRMFNTGISSYLHQGYSQTI